MASLGLSICRNLVKCNLYNVQRESVRHMKRHYAPTLLVFKRRKDKLEFKFGPQPIPRRSSFLDWNYDSELYAFQKRLNEEFKDSALRSALIHQSYIEAEIARQKEVGIEDVQLEMTSNSVLAAKGEQIIEDHCRAFLRYALPYFPEEGIRSVVKHLMSEEVLAHISTHIGTKDLILCSEWPVSESTLATTLKAVVGALAESSGIERTRQFVEDFVLTQLAGKDINEFWQITDPVGTLVDILKRDGYSEPEPRIIFETGRNTIMAVYHIGLYSDKKLIGEGSGETIDTAQQIAALNALKKLFQTDDTMVPLPFGGKADRNLVAESGKQCNKSITEWTTSNVAQN